MFGIVQLVSLFIAGNTLLYAAEYTGSKVCFECHKDQYNSFIVSGHPYKLSKAEDAKKRAIPLPEGYSWDDISYVIGGAYKKSRYIDKQGFIITSAKDGSDLKTQYNLETGTWSFYHKGERKPYTCGACHTTGFKPQGNQGGLPGIKGTWAAEGIQCEACHGPAGGHVKSGDKTKIVVDKSSALCGKCHARGTKDTIPAKKGFIRHHEQFNELLASPHKAMNCVSCHDPHKKAQFSIKKSCSSCHSTQANKFKGSLMEQVGVKCVDCHMPRATKSAVARSKFEGDIRTHLYQINTEAGASMFYSEKSGVKKKEFAKGYVTVDFACLNCHKNKNRKWALSHTKGIHAYK
jgi:hypothetical protein